MLIVKWPIFCNSSRSVNAWLMSCAIGIARAFAYGGAKGRAMHDPGVPPEIHASFEAYKKNSGPTLNHFYEKLLLLKDRMQTDAGRRMAAERHQFMAEFVRRFLAEWDGIE